MVKIEMHFPSLLKLWEFCMVTGKRVIKTSFRKQTIVCECTEAEIELATHLYQADTKKMA
ncbi:MAG: hypothetical protein EON98_05540 [Chitinophagaceae bacterium]|nr:MAG: hypothetical protein EON98_05540 [Chitinophagaceae bacterium]